MSCHLKYFIFTICLGISSLQLYGQDAASELSTTPTLQELLDYALVNRITIRNAYIGEEIGEKEIKSALSGYFPQLMASGAVSHFIQIPTTIIGGNLIEMGQRNTSNLLAQASQAILNPELMRASRAARLIRERTKQTVEDEKINAVVDVSKAYYDILTTEEQIKIIQENILRIQQQFTDANVRYEVGLVDKTDYKRAQISLNNAQADLKKTHEFRKFKYDFLKQLLALPLSYPMDLSFNKENLEAQVMLDTTEVLIEERRIEYRQLQNMKREQELTTQFQKWQFLPTVSAAASYQLNYFNTEFNQLYNRAFPASSVGLTFSVPIFQGFRRQHDIRRSQLQEMQLDWDMVDLKNRIGAEYSEAITNYRAFMTDWKVSRENVALSEEVYDIIKLQYDEGIKTYLDLMTSETDLRTSQLNYLNALYTLLASKIDVERALGNIQIQ
ncbi:TolC family protein [Sphingobacterium sp. lm-10]|uniref:TolC family protein n=1 Tax=Sphingobacterium sp. lm-10 TaxID=2944904 RepID=UPI00201FBBFD|nr:TolC family protein [Sphingobacterium sp. lm-10]MCL7989100.1 TolC family protein [Sphingobacterium sp. lm-10]